MIVEIKSAISKIIKKITKKANEKKIKPAPDGSVIQSTEGRTMIKENGFFREASRHEIKEIADKIGCNGMLAVPVLTKGQIKLLEE